MDEILKSADALTALILKSREYREYQAVRHRIEADPHLEEMVLKLQREIYEIRMEKGSGIPEGPEALKPDLRYFLRDPEVNALLAAENNFCRLMQKVYRRIAEGIDFSVPITGADHE